MNDARPALAARSGSRPHRYRALNFGFKAEIVEGHRRELFCAGQTAMDTAVNPQHAGGMRSQIGMAIDNLEAVLTGAGMTFVNIVRATRPAGMGSVISVGASPSRQAHSSMCRTGYAEDQKFPTSARYPAGMGTAQSS
ncbi:MAG: hypothetical protein ACRDTT_05740 [Pseudonocardiaceae bacterium]